MRLLRVLLIFLAAFAVVAFALNTALLAPKMDGTPKLLAHRGLAQTFPPDGVKGDTCTATRIRPPEHAFLENTIASMRAAFEAGADVVEFDVHPTTDGHFVVFHDWTLDCRTNGKGVTREKTLAELKALDIGYGYTADGGATFPFRGTGIGLMPTLDEVLTAFPYKRFLIHIKSRDAAEGRMLAARLSRLSDDELGRLSVYGSDAPLASLHEILPQVRTMARGTLMQCLARYIGIGWSGYVPAACRGTMLLVPSNYAGMLWGWPNRFLARMQGAGTEVFLLGPYNGGGFSTGIDTALDVGQLPDGYSGGIWTNRVHAVAPLIAAQRR